MARLDQVPPPDSHSPFGSSTQAQTTVGCPCLVISLFLPSDRELREDRVGTASVTTDVPPAQIEAQGRGSSRVPCLDERTQPTRRAFPASSAIISNVQEGGCQLSKPTTGNRLPWGQLPLRTQLASTPG